MQKLDINQLFNVYGSELKNRSDVVLSRAGFNTNKELIKDKLLDFINEFAEYKNTAENDCEVIIAGGVFTANNIYSSDIDIFFINMDYAAIKKFILDYAEAKNIEMQIRNRCVEFRWTAIRVQFIISEFSQISDVLDTFDFDICKIAYSFRDKKIHTYSDTLDELKKWRIMIRKKSIDIRIYNRLYKYCIIKKLGIEFDDDSINAKIREATNFGFSIDHGSCTFSIYVSNKKIENITTYTNKYTGGKAYFGNDKRNLNWQKDLNNPAVHTVYPDKINDENDAFTSVSAFRNGIQGTALEICRPQEAVFNSNLQKLITDNKDLSDVFEFVAYD